MKKAISIILTVLSAAVIYGNSNESVNTEPWKPYSVKDYGAIGDGKTDDTDAIQRCITTVEQKKYQYYLAESAFQEVIFPSGNYLISRPLVIAADNKAMSFSIRGEGKVTITQKNSDKDIFYIHYGFHQTIENITFSGGKIQVKFFSRNINRAQLLIRNCRFIDASSYAIDDSLKGVHHSRIIAPYVIEWKNSLPYAAEVNVDALPDIFFTSTMLHVDNSEFINCMKVARAFADWGVISNSKITTNPAMQGAAIYSRGVLKVKDSSCFARIKDGNNQCFIDNINGGVILQNVTIDTDGAGICPIYNRCIYDNGGLYNIYAVIDGCNIKAAGSPENSFVYCEEVPNLISITNSKETSGKTIPAVGFRQPVTKKYLQYVSYPELVKRLPELAQIYGYLVSMPRIYDIDETKYKHNFAFSLYGNKNLNSNLPAVLEQFVEKPLPEHVMAGFAPRENRFNRGRIKRTQSINAYSFGAKGDGKADDTSAIQQAFDAAGKNPDAELVLPGGLYNISKTVIMPANLSIRGLGRACFKSVSGAETLFAAKDARQLFFANIGFNKAENAVAVTTSAAEKADILFDHCSFAEISGAAVSCLAGRGLAGEPNLTELRITDCTYGIPGQAMITNANNALFDYNWICLYEKSKAGTFVNRGTLRVIDNIGVPGDAAPTVWIDNQHTVIVDNMRFGGEGPLKKDLIENNSPNGKIYMRYSWLYCDEGSIILCNQVPAVAALFANLGTPATGKGLQTMVTMEQQAKGKPIDFLFESCNIPPANFKNSPGIVPQRLNQQ
ncbi:MAG: glycosyl hydrolase family 28-related protein [Victivallaceae bacterium]